MAGPASQFSMGHILYGPFQPPGIRRSLTPPSPPDCWTKTEGPCRPPEVSVGRHVENACQTSRRSSSTNADGRLRNPGCSRSPAPTVRRKASRRNQYEPRFIAEGPRLVCSGLPLPRNSPARKSPVARATHAGARRRAGPRQERQFAMPTSPDEALCRLPPPATAGSGSIRVVLRRMARRHEGPSLGLVGSRTGNRPASAPPPRPGKPDQRRQRPTGTWLRNRPGKVQRLFGLLVFFNMTDRAFCVRPSPAL